MKLKKYDGYIFNEETIKRIFNPNDEFPITIKFYPDKYVGWVKMISCNDDKIKVEMELSSVEEELIKKWTLICSDMVIDIREKPWNFVIYDSVMH